MIDEQEVFFRGFSLILQSWTFALAGFDDEVDQCVAAFEYDLQGFVGVETLSTPVCRRFAANESMDEGIWEDL